MILFYSTFIENNTIILQGDEHTHCYKVLRKQQNDEIKVTDGQGNLYSCTIAEIKKNTTVCTISDITTSQKPFPFLSIGISPTKNPSRLEWFVEKAVEIGISEIIIFQAQRTEKKTLNVSRLEKILISAMKQSLNLYVPALTVVNNFKEFAISCSGFKNKYIAYCDGPTELLSDIYDKDMDGLVLIGPEGDFTPDEIKIAEKLNFKPVSLGNTRLRTETAGLVALIMLRYS